MLVVDLQGDSYCLTDPIILTIDEFPIQTKIIIDKKFPQIQGEDYGEATL